jgi:TonB-linked SusC/RagA family outer membrane protein
MRNLKRWLTAIIMLLFSNLLLAQTKTVTGTVSSDKDGDPVAGVTVTNKKTKKYSMTNSSGYYSLAASEGDELEFSSVGYVKKTLTVRGDGRINVTLAVNTRQESEVVVTAMGIKKDKRGLGTASQNIDGMEVSETQHSNFFNALTGKVAGATVTPTSGAPGASSQLVLRGYNSIGGSNSPLIILDGIPLNNEVFNQHKLASDIDNRNNDYTNRAADINPDDIESINILKGPEAAALYGTEAGNGAIIITTRKGKVQKLKVSYDNNFKFEKIYRFHEIQKVYDVGVNGSSSFAARSSFGPKFAPGTYLYNNVENFFKTGTTQRHNLTMEGGKGVTAYRFTSSYSDQYGVIPNTQFKKINARINVTSRVARNFDIQSSAAYYYNFNRKAFRGTGGYLMNLLLWPQDDDASNYLNVNGARRIVSKTTNSPTGADNPAEANNPYFDVYKNKNFDRVNRVTYNVAFNWDPYHWLNLNLKLGADAYSQFGAYYLHYESNNAYTIGGRIEEYTSRFSAFNNIFIATAKKKWKGLTITGRLGTATDDRSTRDYSIRGDSLNTRDDIDYKKLNASDYTSVFRRVNSRTQGRDTLTLQRSIGVFGELNLNYKDFFYINLTGRNDWLGEFPPENRSYFYPSATATFIFTELLPKNNFLTFGKLRGSTAYTGKRVPPYSNQSVYTNAVGSTNGYGFAYGFTNNNPALFPERQNATEFGTELKFFNNRIGLDLTYYKIKIEKSVVVNGRASYATGFILNTVNIADLENEGIEGILNIQWVKNKKMNWNSRFTFTKTSNKVVGLPLPEYYNSDSWLAGYRASLYLGRPTTTIGGQNYLRNSKGQIIIDPGTGYPLVDPNYTQIGDRNPDFTMGFTNSLSYKNFRLGFTFDLKMGGDVLNGTEQFLYQNGLSVRTLDREQVIVIPGVLNDGLQETANPTINTIAINRNFQNDYYTGRTYAVDFIERDINWLRLRDVTLNYNLGPRALDQLGIFSAASFFITGTDLFIKTNYTGPDPAVNGNTPATGGVGSFAIDLGATSTPRAVNFGMRVTFKNGKK